MSRGSRWGPEGPPEEAYSRVTDAERFRPLHGAMREIIGRLENEFEVEREDGYGLDEELERGLELAGPSFTLNPKNGRRSTYRGGIHELPGSSTCGSGGGTESLSRAAAATRATSRREVRSNGSARWWMM